MYRLVRFFKRYYAVFLFVLLEAGAISYYANSTSYTRATLLAGAARVTGGIEGFFASAGDLPAAPPAAWPAGSCHT